MPSFFPLEHRNVRLETFDNIDNIDTDRKSTTASGVVFVDLAARGPHHPCPSAVVTRNPSPSPLLIVPCSWASSSPALLRGFPPGSLDSTSDAILTQVSPRPLPATSGIWG